MISPEEPLSVNPTFMSQEKRRIAAETLRRLSGETPWEDLLFRRAEAQLLDATMDDVRERRRKERSPELRAILSEELRQLKLEKTALFRRIDSAVAQAGTR